MRICDDPSRAILHSECPFSFISTISLHFGNKQSKCRNCGICIGDLNFNIWATANNYEAWEDEFKKIMAEEPSSFDIDRVLDEMIKYDEQLENLLNKISLIQF